MTALAARGIRKSFGRRQVLTGVDLEVAAGEMVAVVGENGTREDHAAPHPGR